MWNLIGQKIANVANHIGQGVRKTWGTIGGVGHKVNNIVRKVASTVHDISGKLKGIPFADKVHEYSGDVVKYSDLFKSGLEYGDKVANSLERATRTAHDIGTGKLDSNGIKTRMKEHYGDGRGHSHALRSDITDSVRRLIRRNR